MCCRKKGENILTFKVPSTPDAPASAVLAGLQRLRDEYGFSAAGFEGILFGPTIATNAVIELKGARTALLTTRGARDVLEIQRLWRPRLLPSKITNLTIRAGDRIEMAQPGGGLWPGQRP